MLEHRILLQCARARLEPADAANLRALIVGVTDWSPLLALAETHGMLPLLAYHVQAAIGDSPELEGVRASLKATFMENAAQSLMLAAELRGTLDDLSAAHIRVLPYKGPIVALAAYGNLALRRMRDLDLMISPDDIPRAQSILIARGFRQVTPLLRGPLRFRLEYQCLMARETDGVLVELHWMVAPPNVVGGPSFDQLWSRRVYLPFQGVDTPEMSVADVILTLCIHGTKHRWSRLEWIVSVAEIIRSSSADWRPVAALAAQVRAARMVRIGFHLTHALLGAPVSPELREWIHADNGAVVLAKLAAERLLDDTKGMPHFAAELRSFQWRAQDGVAGRLRYLYYWPLIRLARRTAV